MNASEQPKLDQVWMHAYAEQSRVDAKPLPDVNVGDRLYVYEGGEESYYTEFLVIWKCERTQHCLIAELGGCLDRAFPRFANRLTAYEKTLRSAMEKEIRGEIEFLKFSLRRATKALEILENSEDAEKAVELIYEMNAAMENERNGQ